MQRILLIFASCLAMTMNAWGQQGGTAQQTTARPTAAQAKPAAPTDPDAPASKEDIEAYLEVTHSRKMAVEMVATMSKSMQQLMHEEYLKDKDKLPPDFEARMGKQMDDLLKNMPFDEMMDAMIPSFQKHLTKGDVAALVAFYSSATGQKILEEMPQITAEGMQSMMPILQKYMNTMQQRLQEQVAQMLEQSSPAPAKNPPATPN
jgi:hypothetical protein